MTATTAIIAVLIFLVVYIIAKRIFARIKTVAEDADLLGVVAGVIGSLIYLGVFR